jgi:diguanylate cyclase (GGDEF)-like protein
VSFPIRPAVTVHVRPVEGDADELLAFQNVMLWLRLAGVAVILTQGWMYAMLTPLILLATVAFVLAVVVLQVRLLAEELPLAKLRQRATILLVADLLAVYVIGTNFIADPQWIGFYFYPLVSLEAGLVAGAWVGLGVTGLSVTVYLAQLVLHTMLGFSIELRGALGGVSLIAMVGGFMALYADLAGRGRSHLRAMLHLTSTLARHSTRTDAVQHLDHRLHAALGARVRSVMVRDPGGTTHLIEWRSETERVLTSAQLHRAFGGGVPFEAHMEAGEALSVDTDAWSVVTATLGLPEWVASVTLVPILAEDRWIGVLPVLWPARTTPDRDQLRLLHGLAGQIGLAMARGELEQMRRDATVDPLTGLLNRRAIGAELSAFVARSARSNGRLAVVLLEFRRPAGDAGSGDATLQIAANAIRSMLRNGDVAGRHDDDRLLVIAADADPEKAQGLRRRIETVIGNTPETVGLRAAIGIACYPDDGPTAGDLVDAAETAIGAASTRGSARPQLAAMGEGATASR